MMKNPNELACTTSQKPMGTDILPSAPLCSESEYTGQTSLSAYKMRMPLSFRYCYA